MRLPNPPRLSMNTALLIVVLATFLCAWFPGHDDGFLAVIIGTTTIYLAGVFLRRD